MYYRLILPLFATALCAAATDAPGATLGGGESQPQPKPPAADPAIATELAKVKAELADAKAEAAAAKKVDAAQSAKIKELSKALDTLRVKQAESGTPDDLTDGIAVMKARHPGIPGVVARAKALKEWPSLKGSTRIRPHRPLPVPAPTKAPAKT